MAKPKSTELKTLESNLIYVRNTYRKMILNKIKLGKPVERLIERLKAVEIQLWVLKEGEKDGRKDKVSNG